MPYLTLVLTCQHVRSHLLLMQSLSSLIKPSNTVSLYPQKGSSSFSTYRSGLLSSCQLPLKLSAPLPQPLSTASSHTTSRSLPRCLPLFSSSMPRSLPAATSLMQLSTSPHSARFKKPQTISQQLKSICAATSCCMRSSMPSATSSRVCWVTLAPVQASSSPTRTLVR